MGFRRLWLGTPGTRPKAAEPEHQRQRSGGNRNSRNDVVSLVFRRTGNAESPASKQIPIKPFDLLTAITAKVWLVEHSQVDLSG